MLVYANNFMLTASKIPVLEGTDYPDGASSTAAFRPIVEWLSKKTKQPIPDIRKSDDFRQGIYQVRTYAADKREPKLYSVLLTHRDKEIYGRFWSTEISVRLEAASTFISILLETQEISPRITKMPVTTRPILVNSLARNAEFSAGTIGLKFRNLSNSDGDYQALSYEIEKLDRDYPLVLVSCFEGKPLVDPEALQKQLFGLAQVIYISEGSDSRKMARILGQTYSAWDGAINIIFPYIACKGFCYTNLIRRPELEELRQEGCNLLYDILARVTHSTNWLKRRQHFSPVDVRAKRQKDYLLFLQEQAKENGDYKGLFELACQDMEKLAQEKQAAENEALDALAEKEEAEENLKRQTYKLNSQGRKIAAEKRNVDITDAILALSGQKELTPELCLRLAAQQSGAIIVLETALKSARNAADYRNSSALLAALCKLGREFLPAYLAGGGNKAKNIFGTGIYAANESEQTMNNPDCIKARSFSYKGKDIPMWQHLGWGVAK